MECRNCSKSIEKGRELYIWFDWQSEDDGVDEECDPELVKCERCRKKKKNRCDHRYDPTYGPGVFDLPSDGNEFFCSYDCIENKYRGRFLWDSIEFNHPNKTKLEVRFVDVKGTCSKCKKEVEHEWIICYVDDPSLLHKRFLTRK
jgi:hypothetical protein